MTIKSITVINIMHNTDGTDTVYIKHPDLQEMVVADALQDLPEFIEMLFQSRVRGNAALQDTLERAKILYTLSKT